MSESAGTIVLMVTLFTLSPLLTWKVSDFSLNGLNTHPQ